MIVLQPFCDCYTEVLLPFIADFWDVHHAEFSFLKPFEFVHNIPPRAAQCFDAIMILHSALK